MGFPLAMFMIEYIMESRITNRRSVSIALRRIDVKCQASRALVNGSARLVLMAKIECSPWVFEIKHKFINFAPLISLHFI